MDRSKIERLLESAVRPATITVDLPVLGDTLTLRKPTREQALRTITASGDDDDQGARALVAILRFALVDDAGAYILRSFEEAAAFFNILADADLAVLMPKLQDILTAVTSTDSGDVEAGKAH